MNGSGGANDALITPQGSTVLSGGGGGNDGGWYAFLGLAALGLLENNRNRNDGSHYGDVIGFQNLSNQIANQTTDILTSNGFNNVTTAISGVDSNVTAGTISNLQGFNAVGSQICSEGRNTDSNIFGQTQTLTNQNFQLNNQVTNGFANVQSAICNSDMANAMNFKDLALENANNTCKILNTVRDDGDATRSLITSNLIADKNAEIIDLKDAIRDEREECRNNNVNQTLSQQNIIINQLAGAVTTLTNTINNSGAVVTP